MSAISKPKAQRFRATVKTRSPDPRAVIGSFVRTLEKLSIRSQATPRKPELGS